VLETVLALQCFRNDGNLNRDFNSVDFQRDFLENGGFGEVQGGNLAAVQASVKPAAAVLELARRAGLTVVHTREGHEPDLRDCPTSKVGVKQFHLDGC
jgi:nicotinamidase-related amidase